MGHENEELDANVLDVLLTNVRTAQVTSFVYDKPANTGLDADKPSFGRIIVKLSDGTKQEVWLGEITQEDNKRYVKSVDTGYVGVMTSGDVTAIFRPEADFIKKKAESQP